MSAAQLITAIVPGTTPAGNGYRVRVVASDPATVGSDLIIHAFTYGNVKFFFRCVF
jgi:hypothetical protein